MTARPQNVSAADNTAWTAATPILSVLIPFMRDDPRPLLRSLEAEAGGLGGRVEVLLLDDGGGDAPLAAAVAQAVGAMRTPVRFIALEANEGRSKGRNRLAADARADRLLFLDADMLPDRPDFLATYLNLVERTAPAVVFGGFSTLQAPRVRAHALHRRMAESSDCLPAAVRARTPEKYIFTSNLLIPRQVLEAEPFDEGFVGWGWEDVEWGMRVGRRWPIVHIDNAATHLGLDTAAGLIAKYRQSVANFSRVAAAHPDIVAGYPSFRVARLLKLAPLRALWRPLLAGAAKLDWAPTAPRAFALRLYRCALYAETV